MKVLYEKPNDKSYIRWMDNDGIHDIWYKDSVSLINYKEEDLPIELVNFLDEWNEKMKEIKKDYAELCPVKYASIEFIYNDIVYVIYPQTVSATYLSNFLRNDYYEVEWDSLLESYQRKIRDDLNLKLGVKYSRYIGFLD